MKSKRPLTFIIFVLLILSIVQNCSRRHKTPLFRLLDNIDKIEFTETPFPELFGIDAQSSLPITAHPQLKTEVEKILSENLNLDSWPDRLSPSYKLKITKKPSAGSGKGLRSKNVIAAPPTTIFSISSYLPRESSLAFGCGIANESWDDIQGEVQFEIFVEDDDKGTKELIYDRILKPKKRNRDRRWYEEKVNLSKYANRNTTLIFKTSPTKPSKSKNNCVSVWINPTIIEPLKENPYYNVILISIDTLRADHLGCYGYQKNTTPHIDSLSTSGVLFKNVIAQAPYTVSSHMSLLTSLYPSFHKVNLIEFSRLNPSKQTLAEVFYNGGYRTWAITGGGQVSSNYGFYDGFETFIEYTTPHRDVERKVRETINLLEREKGNPLFVFIHTYKPHAPYTPIPPYDKMFSTGYKGQITGSISDIADINNGKTEARQNAVDHIVSLYDGEIREMDDQLGMLFEYLKEEGLIDKTLIVLTSDHGEEFNEHGFVGIHSHTLYNELLRIPLILHLPKVLPERKVIADQVQSIDIFPTILKISGLPYQIKNIQGISVLPLIKGQGLKREPKYAFSERTPSDGHFLRSLQDSSQKYIFEEKAKSGVVKHFFFNLNTDPDEQNNLPLPSKTLRDLFNQIQFLIEEGKKLDEIVKTKKIDRETLEILKALGYIE